MNGYAKSLSVLTVGGAAALFMAANSAAPRGYQDAGPKSQETAPASKPTTKTTSVSGNQEPLALPERRHAYHKEPPTGPLPATLDPREVASRILKPEAVPAAIVVYSMAAKIKDSLYQVPCYCGCDKSIGHESLLNCFTTFHGAACPTCQMAAIYVFEQVKAGKKPAEMRDAMDRGEWGANVSEYVKKHYPEYVEPDGIHHPHNE